MPRRSVLSASERDNLLALPEHESEWIRYYTFSETDHALIRQRRGLANRLGFAVQLCLLRYPGTALSRDKEVSESLIRWVAQHLWLDAAAWDDYGHRDETRREHIQILVAYLGLAPFGVSEFRVLVGELTDIAMQTDKGLVLASHALQSLRQRQVIVPALPVVERACAHAITRANRRLYRRLVNPLTAEHHERLDELLALKPDSHTTWLTWLRQSPLKPNSRHMLEHIERLRCFQALDLPANLGRDIHQNRLLKIAREGAQMTSRDLHKFEPTRRHATLAALAIESRATVTDEIIDLHDRILIKLFAHARNKHQQRFHSQGKAINDKVRLYSAKSQAVTQNRSLLLSAILADGINLGLTKMAESCPGITYGRLSWLQAWHIRDETYTAALAELTNTQLAHPFASYWGDGTTSSSDGQRFRAGGRGEGSGHINPKYGSEPGRLFYTHISDQYAPFHTQVINVGVRDATYVLDGLLYHESDLRIEEHYTDTAGFTDHVFALMHLLGFRFAPRIRDLKDTRLYVPGKTSAYPELQAMIGGTLNIGAIRAHWNEILHLATSIQQGSVTASLMVRKLGSYPRQNSLAVALRELGRIERSLFILDWLQNVDLRRRVHAGLNKGEARNALARAVFLNRLGEIRNRSFEQQRYRASGLNLVTAAIVLWNTVYLEQITKHLRDQGEPVDEQLLSYLSPLGWEHINLTGDYVWQQNRGMTPGQLRPLRTASGPYP